MKSIYLLGYPVSHSVSPAMQNAAFRALGLRYEYSLAPVEPAKLADYLPWIRDGSVRGCNVTVPHKVAVIPLLDALDESARSIGAVNTVVNDSGRLTGYNTDAPGALRAMEEAFGSLKGRRAVILGAGGAARALAHALAAEASVTVLNRDEGKARALAAELPGRATALGWSSLPEAVAEADVLVNATPVGMSPHSENSPVPAELLHSGLTVFDLVYNPLETRLLREARAAGCSVLSGVEMLVYQGTEAFRLWTGREPPVAVMREAALQALGAKP